MNPNHYDSVLQWRKAIKEEKGDMHKDNDMNVRPV